MRPPLFTNYQVLKSHARLALRLLLKDKLYSLLNILGLTLGILSGVIVMLYLQNNLTYDTHHKKHDQIFRLTNRIEMTGFDRNLALCAPELPPLILEEVPELVSFARFVPFNEDASSVIVKSNEKKQFSEDRLYRADSNTFSFFTHQFLKGNPLTCLKGPGKIVLTKSMANKYFGDEEAMGKTIEVKSTLTKNFLVSAIIEDVPGNSHFKFDFLVSEIPTRAWVPYYGFEHTIWNPNAYCYLMFPKGYNFNEFKQRFQPVFNKYYNGDLTKQIGGRYTPRLEPLARIHLHSKTTQDEPQGDLAFNYTFASIGLFIIVLICINYVNLYTARSLTRTKEIGIRKVLGTTRKSLFYAILTEALLVTSIAYGFAIVLSFFLIKTSSLSSLIGQEIDLDLFNNPALLTGSLILLAAITFFSGFYPGILIPSMQPVTALKGAIKSHKSGRFLRKSLVAFQLFISTLVITGTVFMTGQMNFIKHKELGFSKDNILLLKIPDGLSRNQLLSARSVFLNNPKVISATYGQQVPGLSSTDGVFKVEKEGEYIQHLIQQTFVGDDYLKTMDMTLLSGRDFHKNSQADELSAFMVNEALVRIMGWTDDPIGKKITWWDETELGPVIGVVKDYNFTSVHTQIEPMFIRLFREADVGERAGYFHLKIDGKDLPETIGLLEKQWGEIFPEDIFEFQFLDQKYDAQYRSDNLKYGQLAVLSYLCIFISILGLVGLAAFTATFKTKEIGVRKVLGASIYDILVMLSRDYLRITGLTYLFAMPFAYYLIREWLNNFAYKTTIHWWEFIIPGVVILLIVLIAISSQSIKTSLSNPTESLRTE